MCCKAIKTYKCGHRSDAKTIFCDAAMRSAVSCNILESSKRVVDQHDFCCGKECCEYYTKAARLQSVQNISLILHGLEEVPAAQLQASNPEIFDHYKACAEGLKEEVDDHNKCGEKRKMGHGEMSLEQERSARMDSMAEDTGLTSSSNNVVGPLKGDGL